MLLCLQGTEMFFATLRHSFLEYDRIQDPAHWQRWSCLGSDQTSTWIPSRKKASKLIVPNQYCHVSTIQFSGDFSGSETSPKTEPTEPLLPWRRRKFNHTMIQIRRWSQHISYHIYNIIWCLYVPWYTDRSHVCCINVHVLRKSECICTSTIHSISISISIYVYLYI